MAATREMLEGEAYWGRIRSIKRKLYILQAILIATLGFVLLFFYSEFQANPFYISIDRLIWFILIMLLVVELESFVFRVMQVRMGRTFSTKHLMTMNSIRKSIVIIIIAAVALAAFAIPASTQGIEDAASPRGTFNAANPVKFLPGDPLGLSKIITIDVASNIICDVYIVTQSDYQAYSGDMPSLRSTALNSGGSLVTVNRTFVMMPIGQEYLFLVLDPISRPNASFADVSYVMNIELSDTFTSFLPLMAILFLIANGAWIMYLFPMSRKYASKSIYK